MNIATEHRPFMESVIQELLGKTVYRDIVAWVSRFDLDLDTFLNFCNQREFARLLLPLITRKIRKTVPLILAHPALLAHTIYQTLSFDSAFREQGFDLQGTFATRGRDGSKSWLGCSEVILGKDQWFDSWVEGEKKCNSFSQWAREKCADVVKLPKVNTMTFSTRRTHGSLSLTRVMKTLKIWNSAPQILPDA
jgi:RAD50-interacting protein 1